VTNNASRARNKIQMLAEMSKDGNIAKAGLNFVWCV